MALGPAWAFVLNSQLSTLNSSSTPPRNRTSSDRFEVCHAVRHTRRAYSIQYPDLESNQDQDLRRVSCGPLHHRDVSQEPTTGFAPASTGLQDRRLSQSSHVGNKHECEESNPVRQFWRLPALPGAHSCKGSRPLRPGSRWLIIYFSSATFQYASLTNFDQLSIRTLVGRVERVPRRPDRLACAAAFRPAPACGRPCACCTPGTPARSCPSATHRPGHEGRRGRSSAPRCPAGAPQYWQV